MSTKQEYLIFSNQLTSGSFNFLQVGSWVGNLMLKRTYPEFCSDIFISLVAIDARIQIERVDQTTLDIEPEQILSIDMSKAVVISMKIPSQPENTIVQLYIFSINGSINFIIIYLSIDLFIFYLYIDQICHQHLRRKGKERKRRISVPLCY